MPDSVSTIGNYAFSGCNNLTTITASENIIDICANSFEDTAWYDDQPDGIVFFYGIAYGYKGSYTDFDMISNPDIRGVSRGAFYGRHIITANIPDGTTIIGDWTCTNSSIVSITLPATISEIGYYAFYCSHLTTVYYEGTEADYQEINIMLYNDYLEEADIYYYSESPIYDNQHWHYVEDVPTIW
jgi:hypothetical protein